MKVCRETPNLVKLGQKYRAFYMKTEVLVIAAITPVVCNTQYYMQLNRTQAVVLRLHCDGRYVNRPHNVTLHVHCMSCSTDAFPPLKHTFFIP